jgi:hypothetical protein
VDASGGRLTLLVAKTTRRWRQGEKRRCHTRKGDSGSSIIVNHPHLVVKKVTGGLFQRVGGLF